MHHPKVVKRSRRPQLPKKRTRRWNWLIACRAVSTLVIALICFVAQRI